MALPTAWQLLVPNFNVFTVIGILIILLAIFGAGFLKLLGTAIGVKPLGIVFTLIFIGIFFIWGISIIQDLLSSKEFLYILGGIVILVITFLIAFRDRGKQKTLRL